MQRVALVVNFDKDGAVELARKVIGWFEEKGLQVYLTPEHARAAGREDCACEADMLATRADIGVVLGGDGTLLSVARMFARTHVPLIGVNLGYLGFLTEIDAADPFPQLQMVIDGRYSIEERMMLRARVERAGEAMAEFVALNDVVVTKGAFARMIRLQTVVDGEYVDTYPADGIIVSSPTGSTAYSLSAGGPIVNPKVSLLIITPICPHTFYARPLVIPDTQVVRVKVKADHGDIMLTIDGQVGYKLLPEDEISVGRAREVARLVRLSGRSFYEILREKLKSGEEA